MQALAQGARGGRSLRLRLTLEDVIREIQERDALSLASAVYDWFMRRYTFVPDPTDVELVRDPEAVLDDIETFGRFVGDCDDASTFLAAALLCLGMHPVFVRVGFQRPLGGLGQNRYTHVFCAVRDQYGRRVALDPVAGPRTSKMLGQSRVSAIGTQKRRS